MISYDSIAWYCMLLRYWLRRAGCVSQDAYILHNICKYSKYLLIPNGQRWHQLGSVQCMKGSQSVNQSHVASNQSRWSRQRNFFLLLSFLDAATYLAPTPFNTFKFSRITWLSHLASFCELLLFQFAESYVKSMGHSSPPPPPYLPGCPHMVHVWPLWGEHLLSGSWVLA